MRFVPDSVSVNALYTQRICAGGDTGVAEISCRPQLTPATIVSLKHIKTLRTCRRCHPEKRDGCSEGILIVLKNNLPHQVNILGKRRVRTGAYHIFIDGEVRQHNRRNTVHREEFVRIEAYESVVRGKIECPVGRDQRCMPFHHIVKQPVCGGPETEISRRICEGHNPPARRDPHPAILSLYHRVGYSARKYACGIVAAEGVALSVVAKKPLPVASGPDSALGVLVDAHELVDGDVTTPLFAIAVVHKFPGAGKIIAKDSVRISRNPQLPAESFCNPGDVHPVKFRNPDKAVPVAVVSHKSERKAEQDIAGGGLVETVGVVAHFKVVVHPSVPRVEFPDASPRTYPQVVPVAAQRADVGWKLRAEEMQSVVRSVKVE